MPGILPMKVIKVGTSAQSRIAQACDRCRSKKIRCDGVTPCCTQCANVGFECKTSDKLSRRAFPRGYTESLEQRVRDLETEVKELKDILDEKDEKIDILSRVHSGSQLRGPSLEAQGPNIIADRSSGESEYPQEDVFDVQQSPCLLNGENSDSYFMGASSGRAFVDTLKAKIQEDGTSCSDFKPEAFFVSSKTAVSSHRGPSNGFKAKTPPRLLADELVNIFFQEWAPLFPVLHRPTFLSLYTDYMSDPTGLDDKQSIAQLNLVFGIAMLSKQFSKHNACMFECQWQSALDSILLENTLGTLQCLALAQIYCIQKGDYGKLLFYKGVTISLSHRLGLHQSQKRFSLGALTGETRKKIFWTVYTLDCFSAAMLGLPKLLKENDIHTEYPADIDDENVSERGFQPTLPGESTRLSSALALFRGSRVLAKVLEALYPTSVSYSLSLQKLGTLNDELDAWLNSLPPHLRLQFVQDKPSTKVVSDRSPFLSLTYEYIRTLIHRPAAGSTLGSKASSSVVALANSSKHVIQIVQLLDERGMHFTFCLNQSELLLLCGFGLLFQGLVLDRKGKLMHESQRLICSVTSMLERNEALGTADFKRVAFATTSIDHPPSQSIKEGPSRKKSDSVSATPQSMKISSKMQSQAQGSSLCPYSGESIKEEWIDGHQVTAPTLGPGNTDCTCINMPSSVSLGSPGLLADYGCDRGNEYSKASSSTSPPDTLNLDFLSFGDDQVPVSNYRRGETVNMTKQANVGQLSGFVGSGNQLQRSLEGLFPPSEMLHSYINSPLPNPGFDWTADAWITPADMHARTRPACSVQSFSEEEVTSGEELSVGDLGSDYHGVTMANVEGLNSLDGLDGVFNL